MMDDIVCKFALGVLLIYVIELWISPDCSYELNIVFICKKRNHSLCFNITFEINIFKNENNFILCEILPRF